MQAASQPRELSSVNFHGRRVVSYQMIDIQLYWSAVPLQTAGVPQRGGCMDVEGTPCLLSSANVS